ncbi:MAG TPA: polyribonucleotide nucleotidyltransferase [Ruminococcaceae bacterium]|jgi:polyribonucleotide nucleotidyltransferase|nr:polyribonucleotide nucleotidyltransferase [Oscillospiraceae bacterium]
MFENYRVYKTDFGGRPLTVETGKWAQLANGECLVRCGDTAVHVAVTASAGARENARFFPLSVDYEEKLYAVGRIPGSYFRREGRPTEKAVAAGRMIDRSIRPLFPKDLRNGVSVVCTVMSADPDCLPEVAALVGASAALSLSDVPWNGPVSGVSVGFVDGGFVINPTEEQRKKSKMALTVASTRERVVMLEAGADQVPDDVVYAGILEGLKANRPIVEFLKKIQAEIGREKFAYESAEPDEELAQAVEEYAADDIRAALGAGDKRARDAQLQAVCGRAHEKFDPESPDRTAQIDECLFRAQKQVVRRLLLDGQKRVDGRGPDEIRPMAAEVGVLPRAHGSGLFTRGQTQVLTAVTLGPPEAAQPIDGIGGQTVKRYIHQYNMPPYATGDSRPRHGPNRREIGHGALAERALAPVIPPAGEFPYTIRAVSEVLSSDGSTSQAAVCGSTLALMDAGVPIRAPVAGIACGLVAEDGRWTTLTDIQGLEDFFGDMDFKVAGTRAGVTALQMDQKIDGLTPEIIRETLSKARRARDAILDGVLLKALAQPRKELSPYAPKMLSAVIPVEKIRDVIGPGGKTVRRICAECGVQINVEEDGRVRVCGGSLADCRRALGIVDTLAHDPEPGAVFRGRVTRLASFGAFVEIAPGREGLVHLSQLDAGRVGRVEDAVRVGDEVLVKVLGVDEKGRLSLSRRAALKQMEGRAPEAGPSSGSAQRPRH